MAKNAFDEIRRRDECAVLCFDIKNFFGSIDHAILKRNLMKVLRVRRLSEDWFRVFRSMTRYSWVEIDDLLKRLDIDPKKMPWPICTAAEFRANVRGENIEAESIIKTNRKSYEIPQGSPISAVFSNIYMIDFDQQFSEYIKSIRAYYRRYSDDILVVCGLNQEQHVMDKIHGFIELLGPSIELSKNKTEISHFQYDESGELQCDRPATYLGFTFDGSRILLRNRTVSRYYRRMSYATRHTAKAAERAIGIKVFKRKLFRDFTHLGRSNFYSYARRASEILEDVSAKKQLRRHFPVLLRKLRRRGK